MSTTDHDHDPTECEHESVADYAGPPEYSGRCRVYLVCEDCGAEVGTDGWDSVL